MRPIIILSVLLSFILYSGCKNSKKQTIIQSAPLTENNSPAEKDTADLLSSIDTRTSNNSNSIIVPDSINHSSISYPYIGGHLGQDTIIGNFTGHGLDSIWVIERVDTVEEGWTVYNYHTISSNPLLPSVELYGKSNHCAFIVNEGDLDGDGKDEWAWMRGRFSSWAHIDYHLLHFDGKTWKEFVTDIDGETREGNIDFIQKGPVPGSIIIAFKYWPEEETPEPILGYEAIHDPFQGNPLLYKKN